MSGTFDDRLAELIRDAGEEELDGLTDKNGRYTAESVTAWVQARS